MGSLIYKIIIAHAARNIPRNNAVHIISSYPKNELMMKDDLNENFAGRVDSLFFDKSNHNGKYAVLNNNRVCPIIRPWENYIKIGDSLSKKKGSFFWRFTGEIRQK